MTVDVDSLFRRFGPMVHRRCLRLLRDPEEADDAMQDVFVRVLRQPERWVEDRIGALLWTMATQVSLNRLRTRRRRPEDGDALLEHIAAADDTEGRLGVAQWLEQLFAREPAGLRISTQTLAVLRWVDGMTLEEVAQATGMSVAGVRKRLDALRRGALAAQGDDLPLTEAPAASKEFA